MTSEHFYPGQRWVSNTESELGLGLVMSAAHRRVEVIFPAAGERRVYAIDNAPLSRVHYQQGETVRTEAGDSLTIESHIEANHCLIYHALTDSGETVVLPEKDLNSSVQFSKPQDRLFSGQIDTNTAYQLRCQTLKHLRKLQQSSVTGLSGARVQLLPHQLYIASEVGHRFAPRVLLADEVGLGKTIEAGLILHQQLISGQAQRALIVVPDSLLHQWLVEMLRRFNLKFSIIDASSFEEKQEPADDEDESDTSSPEDTTGLTDNPFEGTQLALCTLSCLLEDSKRQILAQEAGWDLLIVDEAHHLRWSEKEVSPEYQCIESLAQKARGLLLLTATPEQLGVASHFARLRLLDPDRYYDLQAFLAEEKQHQPVNQLVEELLSEDRLNTLGDEAFRTSLAGYLGDEPLSALFELAGEPDIKSSDDHLDAEVNKVLAELLDRHGTGRVLFRNTRATVSGFPERHLQTYPLEMPDRLKEPPAGLSSKQLLTPEVSLGESWLVEDSRVQWLADFLLEIRPQKVLVICAHATTAIALEEHLRRTSGILAAVFHEGLSLIARDRAAARFAEEEEGSQVLICSEIGSEGRNFQFAHHLVLFDLPLVPDLLEQRIGRLDRIGQRETIQLHVPFHEHSAQHVALRWYHEGLSSFEHTSPVGQAVFELHGAELQNCLQQPGDDATIEKLVKSTRATADELTQALQQGRDRLLELNSCNQERADWIVDEMIGEERRHHLSGYMEGIFDLFGVEQEHHSTNSLVIRPGDHMLVHGFPGLPEDGVTATFQRDLALSREDMQFLTWEHPMVTGAMDLVINGEFGNTAFCTVRLAPLKPGTILLESIFTLTCIAPANLQLHRYLPLTSIRLLVDHRNTDLSSILSEAHINKLARQAPIHNSRELVRHTRPKITEMITHSEKLAQSSRPELVNQAIATMHAELKTELERLQALAKVNPNIRREEIEELEGLPEKLEAYLSAADLRLDAIRVAMVSE